MVVILILVLVVLAGFGVFRGLLRGTLTLTLIGNDRHSEPVDLDSRPWVYQSTDDQIGRAGQIFILGIPFTRTMHIWIRCPGRPAGDGALRPGGRRYISGIWVSHDPSVRRKELPHDIDLGPTGL